MKRWIGRWLVIVSILHTLFALVVFRTQLAEILSAGLFDTVQQIPMRAATAWFFLFGIVLFLLGVAVDALEKAGTTLPLAIGVGLLFLSVLGVILMPRSGFWLVIPAIIAALMPARRQGHPRLRTPLGK